MSKNFIFLIIFQLQFSSLVAQEKKYLLIFEVASQNNDFFFENIQERYTTQEECFKAIENKIEYLQSEGFLLAKVDSTYKGDFIIRAFVNLGSQFIWEEFSSGNLKAVIQDKVNFNSKKFSLKPFNYKEVNEIFEDILSYSENTGYPFAHVQLDDLDMTENKISAKINYQPGPLILFDSLRITGDVNIDNTFLGNYLRIRKGKPFKQEAINQVERKLNNLPYVKILQKPQVVFEGEQAFLNLDIKKRKAGLIDGIIGFLPNEENPDEVLFTGEFNLKVYNLFNTGKTFQAQWQRLRSESQLFWFRYEHPVFLGTNLEAQVYFRLLREDSSFVSNEQSVSILYEFPNTSRVRFEIQQKNSSAGAGVRFSQANELPQFSEVNFLAYGLGYEWRNLDDLLFPTQGQELFFKALVGEKEIKTNPLLADSLYAGITLKSPQLVIDATFSHYQKLNQRNILKLSLGTAHIFSSNLFTNELFQVGGLTSIRGHNENRFFASSFVYSNLEYRFLIDRESYIFLFYDQSFIQRKSIGFFQEDFPFGFGTGLSFTTKAGVFQLVYALGQSNEQSLAFNRAKFHFGFVARL